MYTIVHNDQANATLEFAECILKMWNRYSCNGVTEALLQLIDTCWLCTVDISLDVTPEIKIQWI